MALCKPLTWHGCDMSEDDSNLTFEEMAEIFNDYLPAEWNRQSLVQLTWPHEGTDWAPILHEAQECFTRIAAAIARYQPLLIVSPQPDEVRRQLAAAGVATDWVSLFECPTNDTWARDHAFITRLRRGRRVLMDFKFNGWGEKFEATLDNEINRRLYEAGAIAGDYQECLDFVLEGGSIESDGEGTLLTTACCLTAPHRNGLSLPQIEERLKLYFKLRRVLWLHHGYLAGDDTDGHIDTLARLCPHGTIAYVQCSDPGDEHYDELRKMEEELQQMRTTGGKPYRLVPLPLPDAIYDDEGERLPATYANFLILNEAVVYPTYGQPQKDEEAARLLASAFAGRDIVGVDCRTLIKQHGSLHCVTMQYPL